MAGRRSGCATSLLISSTHLIRSAVSHRGDELPYEDVLSAAAATRCAREDSQREIPLRSLGVPPAAVAELGALLDDPVIEAVLYARAYTDTRRVSGGHSAQHPRHRGRSGGAVSDARSTRFLARLDGHRPGQLRADPARHSNGPEQRECARLGEPSAILVIAVSSAIGCTELSRLGVVNR